MNRAETTIRVFAHSMQIMVTDNGKIKFSIDGGETKNARTFADGMIFFIGTEEIIIKGELREFKYIKLPPEDYEKLRAAWMQVLQEIEEEKKSALLKGEEQKDILKRVDKWKKRIKKYKINKVKKEYVVHDFTIGAQSYRFFERYLVSDYSMDGVLINPAYSVRRGLPGGAVLQKRGELTFWIYHTEEEGWRTVRELTVNELTCVEIIHKYGLVVNGKLKKWI